MTVLSRNYSLIETHSVWYEAGVKITDWLTQDSSVTAPAEQNDSLLMFNR